MKTSWHWYTITWQHLSLLFSDCAGGLFTYLLFIVIIIYLLFICRIHKQKGKHFIFLSWLKKKWLTQTHYTAGYMSQRID